MKELEKIIELAKKKTVTSDWNEFELTCKDRLSKTLNFNFNNYNTCVIEVGSLIHAYKRHGNKNKEIKMNQIAINFSDYYLISTIINNFEEVSFNGISEKKRLQIIKFKKRINKIIYFCICEIRTGRKKLGFVTMYKKPE